MKSLLLFCCLATSVLFMSAQNLRVPAPSSTQIIRQELGLGTVEVSYSRPNVKGRKVFGDLVPWGKVWRTGANGATTLTFTDTASIGGTKLSPGKYGLLTIPDSTAWTIIITRQLDVTNASAYKSSEDVVRVKVNAKTTKDPLETFTMQFADVKATSVNLSMTWANTSVTLPITTDVNSTVMAQIDNVMNHDNRPYFNAAMYYMDNGKDLNQALAWFNKAIEQAPDAYYILYQKASCLAKLGRKDEAKTTALAGIQSAKIAKNEDYVALNEKLIASLK